MRKKSFWWMITIGVAVWLLWMTLRPQATVSGNLIPITQPARAHGISLFWLIDISGNIVVFIPLGLAVALARQGRAPRHGIVTGIVVGALLSAIIEVTQLTIPSRVSALADWALNVAGATLGAVIGGYIGKLRGRNGR